MKKKFLNILLLFIMTFIWTSCSKEKEYEFLVINETDFFLNEVNFDWCNRNNKISIRPNDTHGPFILTYKTSFYNIFGPGTLCSSVQTYSDSLTTYDNLGGSGIERSQLKLGKLNTVKINVNTNPDNKDKFTFSFD